MSLPLPSRDRPRLARAAGGVRRQKTASNVSARPRLSVVVVNYRQWEATDRLVRQLLATRYASAIEVVIVDNHSPRHPAVARLRRLPRVSLLRWNRNRGFARAVNEGCRLSQGDWFLLLNPDITLSDEFLDRVLEMTVRLERAEPRTGIVGFNLRNSDGSPQPSTGPTPTLAGTLSRMLLPRRNRKYHVLPTASAGPVSWVTGCCLLLRRDCLKDVGGFDEKFFLYYEDVDLCLRARARGWSVRYDPEVVAIHHHPLHSRALPAALRLVTRHSLLMFATKHWPAWQTHCLARLIRVEAQCRGWWSACRGDRPAARIFEQLSALTHDVSAGDFDQARTRLDTVVRRLDLRIGV